MFALTPRLALRPGWPEDAADLARAIGHESVVRNLARAPWPYALGDAQTFLAMPRAAHEPRFLIVRRGAGETLLGGVGLTPAGDAHELGYWLTPDAWGRGYATEAARAVLEMGRDSLGLRRFVARHHIDNPASGRVLAKLGFVETGHSVMPSRGRGGPTPCVEHALDLTEAPPAEDDLPVAA
jgi:RimJ/RimL family protein N-acetyltransferase